ncbi:MAG TPA: DUF72 domain-containing protein [Gemmatimonadota bacterium]|nr:DUF72 domain-containing protein [Gemmatimonadota bacterium]
MSEPPSAKVYIGPAGWSYDDWKGIVYPREAGRPAGRRGRFDPLEYLAGYFDVIEINSSFYRPPPARWTRSWVRRVEENPRFRFTAKLWRRFTHERDSPPSADEIAEYREGIDVLAEEDRLLAVLVQFPWSFRNGPEERQWLATVAGTFADYPLVLEVRHASWDEPDVLAWLAERGIALATIDQPLHDGSLEPVERRTAPRAYYRLHGRNHAAWFAPDRPSHERYNYLYRPEELEPWAARIREAARERGVEAVIAITNNHYQGQAIVNALQLKAWSGEERVAVPEPLREAFPGILEDVALEPPAQPDLFRG